MKKNQSLKSFIEKKDKKEILYLIIVLFNFLVLVGVSIFVTSHTLKHLSPELFCDYDSCSQESYKWNYSGSLCFDSNNSACQDFLRFWNACQEYKRRIGVC